MASKSINKEFPEIDEIRQDLDSLKSNVIELTRHIQETGVDQAHEIGIAAQKKAKQLQKFGKVELQKVEKQIKAHPGQSVALAFAAGMALSLLMGRR